MPIATMTSKGQITIPKEVRDELGLEAGSQLMFVKVSDRHYRLLPRTGSIADLFGILHRPGMTALTIEEINEATAAAAAESGMRGLDRD